MIEIAGLHIYPLKGARGIVLERMTLDPIGPVDDRRWMMVDPGRNLVTQREIPALCRIGARPVAGGLVLDSPGSAPLEISTPEAQDDLTVRVWNDAVLANDAGDRAAEWCSRQLGAPLRLVHLSARANRRTDSDYDPIGGQVSFADGYPILVASEASLADLNRRLEVPLPMNRFRPNIVVRGSEPFVEDGWKRFWVGGLAFDVVKPCARCVVTTTDQQSGERSVEPLRTLATFRRGASGVMFGMNVVHRNVGQIEVGQEIKAGNRE